jgi:hypothetical protein
VVVVAAAVTAVRVSDYIASTVVVVANGKLERRWKWSWPDRGIIPVSAWRN